MNKWKTCTINDLGRVIGGATPSTKKPENYENGNIAWITPKDLAGFSGRYISNGERNITEQGLKSCSAQLIPKHSILFSSRAPIGYIAIAANEVCTNQGFKSIVPNDGIDYLFLYYLLKYNKKKIENLGSGTTFKEVSGSTMKSIQVTIPETIEEQRKISTILSLIDDKIEENEKINKNLEQQAQTLYDKMMVSKVYPLKTLGSITQRNSLKVGNNNSITVLSALNTGNLKPSEEYFSKQVFSKDTSKYILVNEGDFAYNPARINIGSIGINDLGYIGCVSPVYIAFSVDPDYKAFFRFYLKTKGFREECKLRASGSVRQALNYIDFARIETQYPDREEAVIFNQQWNDYHDAICSIVTETEKLIELRDSLLPQLMSGKFNISDINI